MNCLMRFWMMTNRKSKKSWAIFSSSDILFKIASETNDFDVADVLNGISEKLIYRHPHIYGDISVNDEEEVKRNWEN